MRALEPLNRSEPPLKAPPPLGREMSRLPMRSPPLGSWVGRLPILPPPARLPRLPPPPPGRLPRLPPPPPTPPRLPRLPPPRLPPPPPARLPRLPPPAPPLRTLPPGRDTCCRAPAWRFASESPRAVPPYLFAVARSRYGAPPRCAALCCQVPLRLALIFPARLIFALRLKLLKLLTLMLLFPQPVFHPQPPPQAAPIATPTPKEIAAVAA